MINRNTLLLRSSFLHILSDAFIDNFKKLILNLGELSMYCRNKLNLLKSISAECILIYILNDMMELLICIWTCIALDLQAVARRRYREFTKRSFSTLSLPLSLSFSLSGRRLITIGKRSARRGRCSN